MWKLAFAIFFLLAATGNSLAEDFGRDPGNVENSSSSAPDDNLSQILLQLRNGPKTEKTATSTASALMDVSLDNFCSSGQLRDQLLDFIDHNQSVFPFNETRAVALILNVSYANGSDKHPASIPLAVIPPKDAKDAAGNAIKPVVNCNPIVVSNLQAQQPLLLSFTLAYSYHSFKIDAGALGVLTAIGDALGVASLLGPHVAVASVTVLGVSAGLQKVTDDINGKILPLFEKRASSPETSFRWDAKQERISFALGKKLTLTRVWKNSAVDINPTNLDGWPGAFDRSFTASLDSTFTKVGTQLGALQATQSETNYANLCAALQRETTASYGADPASVAIAIYYFQATNSALFAPNKRTCLTDLQIDSLARVHVTKPQYEGALTPSSSRSVQPKQDGTSQAQSDISQDEFDTAKDMMEDLATALKNAPAQSAQNAASLNALRSGLLQLFTRDVIATAYGTDLLPNSERGVDSSVIVDYLIKWGDISHFGCFGKPEAPNTRKSTAETLMFFSQRKLLALVKFTKAAGKDMFSAIDIVKAREEDITRLMGKRKSCGYVENWDPRVDFKTLR